VLDVSFIKLSFPLDKRTDAFNLKPS
jgi:hypothetical protein